MKFRKIIPNLLHPRTSWRKFTHLRGRRKGGLVSVQLKNAETRMLVDLKDEGLSKDIFIYRTREAYATKALIDALRPGQTVIDIGANLGYFVLIEAPVVGPSGRIYAIEPGPSNVELLRKNVKQNDLGDIVDVTQAAIGSHSHQATLHLASRSNLHTLERVSEMDRYVRFNGQTPIQVHALDDFLRLKSIEPSEVSLIRMDIEGYEVEAFAGMPSTLAAADELTVFIELHPKLIKERLGTDHYKRFLQDLVNAGLRPVGGAESLVSRHDREIEINDLMDLEDAHEAVELFIHKAKA